MFPPMLSVTSLYPAACHRVSRSMGAPAVFERSLRLPAQVVFDVPACCTHSDAGLVASLLGVASLLCLMSLPDFTQVLA